MTESEAIKEVRFNMSKIGLNNKTAERVREAKNMAIQALEKQIPKKVLSTQDKEFALCPCCNGKGLSDKQKYCDNCGCKLDWSDEE